MTDRRLERNKPIAAALAGSRYYTRSKMDDENRMVKALEPTNMDRALSGPRHWPAGKNEPVGYVRCSKGGIHPADFDCEKPRS